MKPCLYCLLLLSLAMPWYRVAAQVDTIRANPKAVRLRELWIKRGAQEQANVGIGCGGLGDVNNDSISDFAVNTNGVWDVFLGSSPAPGDIPVWHVTPPNGGLLYSEISHPVHGHFRGPEVNVFGFISSHIYDATGNRFPELNLYQAGTQYVDTMPISRIKFNDSLQNKIVVWNASVSDLLVSNLDGDDADELIAVCPVVVRNGVYSSNAEITIYKGGPRFPADTPRVRITDTEANKDRFFVSVGDFDGDHAVDLLTMGRYPDGDKMKFYFGDPNDPAAWTRWNIPDRVVLLAGNDYPFLGLNPITLDCDGDGLQDIFVNGRDGLWCLYRSNSTVKNVRTRSFNRDDADRTFYNQLLMNTVRAGFLNDSTSRYAMLGLAGGDLPSGKDFRGLSGGPFGADELYEVYYQDGLESFFANVQPIGDCNGDGWSDVIAGLNGWYSNLSYGKAGVFAGGPYIPTDDPSVGLEGFAVTGQTKPQIFVWPQPMIKQLNIAWHANMKLLPATFQVHDLNGRLMATGSVDPYHGSALWQAGPDVPSGAYLLSVFEKTGLLIATKSIIKH